MASLNELCTLKQLNKETIENIIRESLYQTISKRLGPENELDIKADFKTNKLNVTFKRMVVTTDTKLGEISMKEAMQIAEGPVELGDMVTVEMAITDFEPKIVNTARKAIRDRIKLLETDRILVDYERQKNTIVTGKVKSSDYNGYKVDLGFAEGLLPSEEQMEDEYYKIGDIIRAYVTNIRKRESGVTVLLSRATPEFVKKLFEIEVPEILSGEIEIKKIVREPGIRTKVVVSTNKPGIDPAGSCLGLKGTRIDQIRKELHGEQIDIVVHDNDPEVLIANSIGPDLIDRILVSERGKFARVIVSEKNKNLAIGKKGKNVKLAGKLTGYKLDIFTIEEYEEKMAEERRVTSHISELDGVTSKIAEILKLHGYTSVEDVYRASVDELCNLEGIGQKTAEKIKETAKLF